jgi:hypothetical protein
MDTVNTSITLGKREISIVRQFMPLRELKFYAENPRIYSIVHTVNDDEPDQEEIQSALEKQQHVKQLIQAIRENGGLTDPLLVRGTDNAVLEGNSRLAAYYWLAKRDTLKWNKVKCDVVMDKISNEDVTMLLSSYHIIGRKSWDPFEQAGMFWRWQKEGTPLKTILERVECMGISSKLIKQWINVYSFMVNHKDTKSPKWSYYYELLKSRDVQEHSKENPKFLDVAADQIKSGKIKRAIDIRDKVTKIARAGGMAAKHFGKKPLEKCFQYASATGATDVLYNKLHKFREVICSPETADDIMGMPPRVSGKCKHELNQIKLRAMRLIKLIK